MRGYFMSDIFTTEELDQQLADFKAALRAVSVNKEYSIGGRRYTRADVDEIRKTLEWLNAEKNRVLNGQAPGPQCNPAIPAR